MLTVPKEEIVPGNQYWILEWCDELGKTGVYGKGLAPVNIIQFGGGYGTAYEFGENGFTCHYSHSYENIEVWGDDSWYAAVFPNQAAMKLGALEVINIWGDDLPMGVYKELQVIINGG